MGDCRKHFKQQILDDIKSIIVGNAKSYTVTDTEVFIPFNSDSKIKTKRVSYEIAKRKVSEINSKYYGKLFGNTVSVNNGYTNGTSINIHIPKTLIDAYVRKHQEQEAREVQMADAKRSGITEEMYSDDYGFDYLPASADGYNYGLYLDNKIKMRKYFSQRIAVLEEIPNKSKRDLEQIQEFKEIVQRLSRDIKNLDNETAVLENFFDYFNKDLNIIDEILLENPTLDNLMSARNFVDMMKFVYEFDIDSENKLREDKEVFSDKFYQKLENEEHIKLFDDFINKLERIDKALEEKEIIFTTQQIDATINGNDIDVVTNDTNSLVKKIKDISELSALILPIDGDAKSSPLQKFVRKTYDDTVGKEETFNLRQELNNIKPKLEIKLKSLGYTNENGFLGGLFSSVNYDIFKRKTKNNRNKLAGKFNDTWSTFENNIAIKFNNIEQIIFKKNKDVQDYNDIKQSRKKLFDLLNENVNFIDVRRLPELANNPELQQNFGAFFKRNEANSYKEEIIQSLIGESGNRKIAERIYNKIIEDQLNKVYSFEISMEQYKNRLLKKNGVDNIQELPEKDRNKFLEKYYTESPFAFSESYESTGNSNVTKLYYIQGEQKQSSDVATMQYVSYLPSQRKYFDNQFEKEIESDDLLYQSWELFDDGLTYINRNRKYQKNNEIKEFDDSLTYEYDMLKQHNNSIMGMVSFFSKSALDRFKNVISTMKFIDTKKDLKLQGSIRSIDEVVKSRMKPVIAVMMAQNLKLNQVYTPDSLPESARNYLMNESIKSLPPSFILEDLIRNITEQKVLNEQNLDLIDTLTSQLETVEMFKAKKEIETKMLFARNQIERVKKAGDAVQKKFAINTVRAFINKHLYGINNRPNWMTYKKSDANLTTVFNSHEKEMIAEIDKAINLIKELSNESNEEQAIQDIAELEAIKNSKGRVVTTGSIFETIAIKLNILVGLGLNVPSQIGNYFMGNIAGRQNDGLEWSEGNYTKAASYTRKWKIARRKLSNKEKAKYKLTNTLIDGLGIFQNSANELDRIKESAYQNKLLKFISNPLHIVGEMEKTIQRPQILAVMGDISIKDNDGNEVPAFDVNNTENPHPAFKLDENGNLILKPEFDNEENRNTWINRNSQEYVNLFGESGTVPTMIAKINGDYRNTSTTLIKESSIGSLMMMFKTWLPAFILRRYGSKDGVISNLITSDRATEASAMTSLTAMMYAGIGASVIVSPMFSIGLTAAYLGHKKHKMLIAQEGAYLMNLMKELQKTFFSLQFATNTVRLTGATGVKLAQQGSDLIFGKRFISNDLINQIAGFEQKEGESDLEFEKNKARLQFLLTEASTTMTLLMLKILVNALMFPDEDEEKQFKDERGIDKFINQPDIATYYFLENMLTRFADDANLMNDPMQASKNLFDGSNSDFFSRGSNLLKSFSDQYYEGDFQRGPNAGKNRIVVNLEKIAVPRGLTDFTLGFSKVSSQDYKLKDPINRVFRSDFDKFEDERNKQRTERKIELQEQYEKRYPNKSKEQIDKKVQKKLRKEFPTIKKYFNPDGSLKSNKKRKVEKYME
jgi:hypothetical protein